MSSVSILKGQFNYSDLFRLTPKDLEIVFDWLQPQNNKCQSQIKTGGVCKRCKLPDPYAPLDAKGECFCYQCFDWQKGF